jgi:acyl-CoA thioesterase FadM
MTVGLVSDQTSLPYSHHIHHGFIIGPDDCDYNIHLSNSSYPKILDSARFKLAITLTPSFLNQGGNIFLAGRSIMARYLHQPFLMQVLYQERISTSSEKYLWAVGTKFE